MADQLAITGNASSLHTSGRMARRVVEESRERLAKALGARPSEVVFTSGGTESDNLAVAGTFEARREADPAPHPAIVCSAIEHHAVLDCVEHLVAHEGAKVTWVEPDALPASSPPRRCAPRSRRTPTRSPWSRVMWANNEVGTVQPVRALAALAHEFGVPFHTDAVQAAGHLPVDFAESRRRPDDGDRPQGRGTARGRGAARPPRRGGRAAELWWGTGAADPQRHPRRPRDPRLRRRHGGVRRPSLASRRPDWSRCATG